MASTDYLLGWLICHRLGSLKKDLGDRPIPFPTEMDLNQITDVINGPVGVAPPPADPHISFIDVSDLADLASTFDVQASQSI